MNAYQEMITRHQAEFNSFPMFFAFSQQQFTDGMQKLGLNPTDTNSICSFGAGGFYRKSDAPQLRAMLDRHHQEIADAIAADLTGDGFIYDMFDYELANHEYAYTQDLSDTLDALNLTVEKVNADSRFLHALQKATKAQTEWYEQENAEVSISDMDTAQKPAAESVAETPLMGM